MAIAVVVVDASAARFIALVTAAAYVCLAAIATALIGNIWNIACIINTMQYFVFISNMIMAVYTSRCCINNGWINMLRLREWIEVFDGVDDIYYGGE